MDKKNSMLRVAAAVGLIAGAGLAFEVVLTRIFSLMFQYHFVFLSVSLAVLGLGLGAAASYAARRRGWAGEGAVSVSAFGLPAAFIVCALLLANLSSADHVPLAALIALIPFVLTGWINALIYARHPENTGLIYGADLVGAALGLAITSPLLSLFGPFGTAAALGVPAALGALLLADSWEIRVLDGIAALSMGIFALVNPAAGIIAYHPDRIADAPPDKTMLQILSDPDRDADIIATEWGPFAQVDVVETDDPDARFAFTDAGAGSIMLRYDPESQDPTDPAFSWLEREVAYLPFQTGPVGHTLIIGAGAGFDVFMAKRAGAEIVTAVEVNPAIVKVTREMAPYNGGVLDLPGVETVIADGRNFVERADSQYDLIYLNIVYTQAAAAGVSSLVEDHVFTVEALRAYWDRLAAGGRIAFVTHNGMEGVRLLMTAVTALQQGKNLSIDEALYHTALLMTPNPDNPTVAPSVLLVRRDPFTEDEAVALGRAAAALNLNPLFMPHLFEGPVEMLLDGSMTLDEYLANNRDYNIFPPTDDRPFFYHLDPGVPGPLITVSGLAGLLTLGYFIVIAVTQPKKPRHEWARIALAVVFMLLGAGFMLAEIALQQRFGLLLGDPILSMVVTVGALLVGGSLGSLFSRRFNPGRLRLLIGAAAIAIGISLLAAVMLYPALVRAALSLPQAGRVLVTAAALLPLGFLMGIPFPTGLRLAGEADPEGVPLFWGLNAAASTFGGALATVLALLIGFNAAFLSGAFFYLIAAAMVFGVWRRI